MRWVAESVLSFLIEFCFLFVLSIQFNEYYTNGNSNSAYGDDCLLFRFIA